MEIYVVRPGDSVDQIAQEFSVPTESIIWNNQLVFPYPLAVGQALLIGEYDETANPRRIDAGGMLILISATGFCSRPFLF